MEQGYISVYNNIFPTLFAISAEEQSKGLMFEPYPPPIMSFVYAYPSINKFWMKNTISPLDIVFCCNNKVSQICFGIPESTEIIGADKFSDLIIEFPSGTVSSSGIRLGQSVEIVKPKLDELKKIIAEKRHEFVKL